MKKSTIVLIIACIVSAIAIGSLVGVFVLSSNANKLDAKVDDNKIQAEKALSTAINDANNNLETAISDAMTKAETELKTAVDTLKTLLAEGDQANALALSEASEQLSLAIAEAEQSLKVDISETNTALNQLATDLRTETANAIALLDTVYVKLDNWDAATDDVIAATLKVSGHYNSLFKDMYYPEDWNTISAIYEETKILLLRATDETVITEFVDNETTGYFAQVEAIPTKRQIIYTTLTQFGTTPAEIVYNEDWGKAIKDAEILINAENNQRVLAALSDIITLAEQMRARYDFLEEQHLAADVLNDRVIALRTALSETGYTAITKAEYERIIAEVETWDNATDELNAFMINREALELMKSEYEAAVNAYETAGNTLKEKLSVYNDPTYVYTYNADLASINALYEEGVAWRVDVEKRKFTLDGTFESPINLALTLFTLDTYDRAQKLEQAYAEATLNEELMLSLKNDIESMTVVKSTFKDRYQIIEGNYATWKNTYFMTPYESEAVEGNVNYELFNHALMAELTQLYNDRLADVLDKADILMADIARIKTITVMSGSDINTAKNTYLEFIGMLNGYGYEIEGLAAPENIQAYFDQKTAEYQAISAQAITEYGALTILDPTTVAKNNASEVKALVKWYSTYFGVNANDATSNLPVESIIITNGSVSLTVTSEMYENVKAVVAAYNAL